MCVFALFTVMGVLDPSCGSRQDEVILLDSPSIFIVLDVVFVYVYWMELLFYVCQERHSYVYIHSGFLSFEHKNYKLDRWRCVIE